VQGLQGCRLAARFGLARALEEGLDFVMPRREQSIHLLVRQVFAQGGSDFAEIPAEFGVHVHWTNIAELAFPREAADESPIEFIQRYGACFEPATGLGGIDVLVPVEV
jgi:hypothetical protein